MDDLWQGNIGFRDGDGGKLINTLQAKYRVLSTKVTVGTSATEIPTTPLSKRRGMLIQNISGNIIYLGGSNVSTTNGFRLYPRVVHIGNYSDDVDVYGVVAAGTEDIIAFEGA